MTMAAVFVAQASGVHLSAREQLSILAILMLTSKGASGVTASGFVTLTATLAAIPSIPPAALALLVGVDRFMSEVRAITNLIGNAVATVAIARWDNALDLPRAQAVLRSPAGSEDPAVTVDVQGASPSAAASYVASDEVGRSLVASKSLLASDFVRRYIGRSGRL